MFKRDFLLPLLLTSLITIYATPITISAREEDTTEESWTISEMKSNFMTEYTGFNWKFWPEYQFKDSTLDFVISLPDSRAKCHASWPTSYEKLSTGTLPMSEEIFDCVLVGGASDTDEKMNESVQFALRKYEDGTGRRAEMGFVVMMLRRVGDELTYGEAPITSSGSQRGPTDYLTCLYFQPYDGMHCSMHSVSDNGKDISILATVLTEVELSPEEKEQLTKENDVSNGNATGEDMKVYDLGVNAAEKQGEGMGMHHLTAGVCPKGRVEGKCPTVNCYAMMGCVFGVISCCVKA